MRESDVTTDTAGSSREHRLAAWALLGFTLIVAAVTFVLSFHGLDGYGRTVAKVGPHLSWLVPIGVDGLTLTAVAATFLLRNSRLRVRLYAWSVFVIANAASVAGNLSHGRSQGLATDGMIGAAAWPILLALASHLAIVTRRALERDKSQGRPEPEPRPELRPVREPELPPRRDGPQPELPATAEAEVRPSSGPEVPPTPEPEVEGGTSAGSSTPGTGSSGRNNGRKSATGTSAPKSRNNSKPATGSSARRTAEETRKLALELRAQEPEITQSALARQLGISDRQLRNVLRGDAAEGSDEEHLPEPTNGRHPAATPN